MHKYDQKMKSHNRVDSDNFLTSTQDSSLREGERDTQAKMGPCLYSQSETVEHRTALL